MEANKKSDSSGTESISADKNISISGDVSGVVVVGNENTVNQTIIQKFFNIFKSDSETLEQRNRRILLNHVENAWIKGVLDASLHGAALLDLGIKPDPEAVTQYPWTLKKESTDETLSAGLSMLEIFDSIGMGRSLLILGAPGSGKTTMLLELARGLIARAREDVTQPIPMVFNLASWTENLTLTDWLAHELNNLYSIPRKTAPDWVKGNKLLLLLDGLDEVRQESRAKCVEAINEFRKQNGLTSLAVCSRSHDYADLKAKLSFEGAIEVQPLTQGQIAEFFNRFGAEMAGFKQALEKDRGLREMAETPLFLSIMLMAYRDKQDVEILASGDKKARRKHLFDTYIERMFEHPRVKNTLLQKQDILNRLSWLSVKILMSNQVSWSIEGIPLDWLKTERKLKFYRIIPLLFSMLIFGIIFFVNFRLIGKLSDSLTSGLIGGMFFGWIFRHRQINNIVDSFYWNWKKILFWLILGLICGFIISMPGFKNGDWMIIWNISGLVIGLICGPIIAILFGLFVSLFYGKKTGLLGGLMAIGMVFVVFYLYIGVPMGLMSGLVAGLSDKIGNGLDNRLTIVSMFGLIFGFNSMLSLKNVGQTTYPGQMLFFIKKSFLFTFSAFGAVFGLFIGLIYGLVFGIVLGISGGLIFGMVYGGSFLLEHYTLRFILARNNLLPWRLIPFLDHCVDLIFLRRVGGGYIFVHRLLMEHFAEMYVETPMSKGNEE